MKRFMSALLVLALWLTGGTPALAQEKTHPGVAQLEAEVREVFDYFLSRDAVGKWQVNEARAAAKGKDLSELRTMAAQLNTADKPATNRADASSDGSVEPMHRVGTKVWGKCVIGFVFPGVTDAFVSGALISWLAKGKYAQVASYLLRAVGPAALKGGGVGLAASLAAGVAWCSTPWA